VPKTSSVHGREDSNREGERTPRERGGSSDASLEVVAPKKRAKLFASEKLRRTSAAARADSPLSAPR
jgi:hypothetical protein